jgi:hypothetical protein
VKTNNAIRQPDGYHSEIAGGTFAREAHATKMDVQAAMDAALPKTGVLLSSVVPFAPWIPRLRDKASALHSIVYPPICNSIGPIFPTLLNQ